MSFVWYELITTDREIARNFYGSVCGWRFAGDNEYAEIIGGAGGRIGGIMTRPPEAEAMPNMWLGYIGVEDVEIAIDRLQTGGGALQKGPHAISGVGRWAVVQDPQGAAFYLFEPAKPESGVALTPAAGWHELYSPQPEEALSFYCAQFGFEPDEVMDMGAHGKYRMFRDRRGERAIGGIMSLPAPDCPAMWNFYFLVPSVAAAAEKIPATGGKVRMGPMQVPGGSWVLQGVDPLGASFALNSLST